MMRDEFLTEIDQFLSRHGISGAKLGLLAVNDSGFLSRLRNGKDVRLSTVERVREFMAQENSKRSEPAA